MMKKIVLLALFIGSVVMASAQGFPSTDSLRNYNTRFTTNSAITWFTNLRGQTLLRGIIDYIDTAKNGAIDTAYKTGDTLYIVTKKPATYKIYIAPGGGGVSDGDKGDVVISSSGTVYTIDANAVTDSKLRQSAALSIIGRSANSTGNVADISAATSGHVLRRSGTTLGFGTIDSTSVPDLHSEAYYNTKYQAVGGGAGSQSLQSVLGIGNKTNTTIEDTLSGSSVYMVGWKGTPANNGTSYGSYGTAYSASGLGWQQFNGVNPSGRPNVVFTLFGYNHDMNGARINTGDASIGKRFESHFESGVEKLFEIHEWDFIDTAGTSHRLFSNYLDKTGVRPSVWSMNGDGILFSKWNDENNAWGLYKPGVISNMHYKKNQTWPYLELGALSTVDSVNNVPWATKWNFKIENQKNEVSIGRPSAVAADLAAIRFYDRIYIGQTGSSGRRYLETYGNVFHAEGNLVVDQLSGSGSAFLAKVNGSTKFEVGQSFTYTYNTIYALGNALHTVGSVSGTVGGSSLVSTIFEANSSSKSAMLPVLTTTARNSLSSPQTAMIHYNSDSSNYEFRDGSGWKTFASREWVRANFGSGGTPGGSNTQVQFNNSGAFGGSANFTWNNGSNALGLGNSGTTAYLNIAAGTTSKALFNFGTGAAPSSPSAGDFWFDVADSSFKYRIGSNSLKWLYSKDQVVSTGLLLKPGAGTVADTIGVGGGTAGQVLVSNGSTSYATWTDLPAFAEGTYTASITNVTNVGTSSISTCYYQRRGDMVEVFGEITIDPTATGDTHLRITLPVSSAISNTYDLSGQATTYDNTQSIRIYGDTTNSAAIFRLNASVDASSHVYSFRFIYKYTAP